MNNEERLTTLISSIVYYPFYLRQGVLDDPAVLPQDFRGTGKELIAKAIHYNSPRKSKRLVAVNVSALQDTLLESELFGHIKGAFTGAYTTKKGLFEIADEGTLFLDEIGDTTPTLQAKLLRALQEHEFTPVGGTTPPSKWM
jgi:two-component system response regulator HupR/HoxA